MLEINANYIKKFFAKQSLKRRHISYVVLQNNNNICEVENELDDYTIISLISGFIYSNVASRSMKPFSILSDVAISSCTVTRICCVENMNN